ncbi:hypothetical protein [Lewinella cohaerens]|uniref:hypothetical protein n=1 Tax=Lewinella cohaerens TaxID=70995 RepID=UPI000381100E|nr:hypothetical protein [Lewinella cohaerens]
MRLLFFVFIQVFCVLVIYGQIPYQNKAAYQNNVAIKSTFVVLKDGVAVDKTLSRQEEFNVLGYPLRRTFFEDEIKTVYLFEYLNDSTTTKRVTLFNDSIAVTSQIVHKGNRTITTSYDAEGQEMDSYSIDEFTKDGRLKKAQIFHKDEMLLHTLFKYYKNGEIKRIKVLVGDKRVVRFDREGNRTSSVEALFEVIDQSTTKTDNGIVVVSESRRYNRGGEARLKRGDVVKVDSYQNENGLLLYRTETINGELESKWVYEYVFREK